jgi:hypothetical protein
MHVIRNEVGDYWSNDIGWTSYPQLAEIFEPQEMIDFILPIGGKWYIAWFIYDA